MFDEVFAAHFLAVRGQFCTVFNLVFAEVFVAELFEFRCVGGEVFRAQCCESFFECGFFTAVAFLVRLRADLFAHVLFDLALDNFFQVDDRLRLGDLADFFFDVLFRFVFCFCDLVKLVVGADVKRDVLDRLAGGLVRGDRREQRFHLRFRSAVFVVQRQTVHRSGRRRAVRQ